jgi:hypothetical protein
MKRLETLGIGLAVSSLVFIPKATGTGRLNGVVLELWTDRIGGGSPRGKSIRRESRARPRSFAWPIWFRCAQFFAEAAGSLISGSLVVALIGGNEFLTDGQKRHSLLQLAHPRIQPARVRLPLQEVLVIAFHQPFERLGGTEEIRHHRGMR